MMSLLRALHFHAKKRGDGLLPQLLNLSPWPHDRPMNENSAAAAEANLQGRKVKQIVPLCKTPVGASKSVPQPDLSVSKTIRKPVIF